jgi:hypothetical protein
MERITKLDAARRQLHTAIHLSLSNKDAVSIHTLTMAAHEILRQLLKAKGSGSFFKDSLSLSRQAKKRFEELLNRPAGFFKHAGSGANGVMNFHPKTTEYWLSECCTMYRQLTGKPSRESAAFIMWFSREYPDFPGPELEESTRAHLRAGTLRKISKASCLRFIDRPDLYEKFDWLEDNKGRS